MAHPGKNNSSVNVVFVVVVIVVVTSGLSVFLFCPSVVVVVTKIWCGWRIRVKTKVT